MSLLFFFFNNVGFPSLESRDETYYVLTTVVETDVGRKMTQIPRPQIGKTERILHFCIPFNLLMTSEML